MSWPHPCSQVQLPACWKDIGEGFGKGVWDFRGSLGPLVLVVTLQWSSPYPVLHCLVAVSQRWVRVLVDKTRMSVRSFIQHCFVIDKALPREARHGLCLLSDRQLGSTYTAW